jgi:hypothetical protein
MTIKATCPDCQTTFNYADDQAGQLVRCDHCRAPVVVPGADDRGDDEESRALDRPPKPSRSGSSYVGWILGAICLLVAALSLGGGALVAWWFTRAVANMQAQMQAAMAIYPGAIPEDEDEALVWIKQGGVPRDNAAQWLAGQKVDPQRRAEIAAALEKALEDPTLDLMGVPSARKNLVSALVVYAGPENVPALIESLDHEIDDDVVDALIKFRDERGPPALAKQLESANADEASAALQLMHDKGIPIEDAVAAFLLTTKEDSAKREAIELLGKVGTPKSLPKLEQAMREDKTLQEVGQEAVAAIKKRHPAK